MIQVGDTKEDIGQNVVSSVILLLFYDSHSAIMCAENDMIVCSLDRVLKMVSLEE